MSLFYLVVAPGLEDLAQQELIEKWERISRVNSKLFTNAPTIVKRPGGVEVRCANAEGWILNHYLKIPTRILQQVDHFHVKDFPKLFQKVKKLPWHSYLRQGPVSVKVAAAASRLKIKDRIQETVLKAIVASGEHQSFRKAFLETPQTVFIRIHEDEVTVSLDTSGDPLYRRGFKKFSVDAPIRETLAAGLFFASVRGRNELLRAVVDPMCGSGTLLFESLSFWKSIRSRKFAYENFPVAPSQIPLHARPDLDENAPTGLGFDLEPKAIEASIANREIFQKFYKASLEFHQSDCFQADIKIQAHPALMILNPPYNERIITDSKDLVRRLKLLIEKTKPDLFAIIWPGYNLPSFGPLYNVHHSIRTKNGGIPVVMGILGR